MLDGVVDDLLAYSLSGLERRHLGRVISGNHFLQALGNLGAGFTVVVADGAKHEDTSGIDSPCLIQKRKCLQDARIFYVSELEVAPLGGVPPGVGPVFEF
jgi:hypothetical protein